MAPAAKPLTIARVAINDLVGRHLGVPLADLFGGAVRAVFEPMYLHWGLNIT